MTFSNFDRFIGIDWSGSRDPRRGLRVAQCFKGTAAPQIVLKSDGGNSRRKEVLDWLGWINSQEERLIAGFDFAFAYPYCDKQAYFPGHRRTPKKAHTLWGLIDAVCQEAEDFYGGPFYLSQDGPFADYLLYQQYKGERYQNRMRITDNRCAKLTGNPSSVFKCVGPESVGSGSIAGMRFLHQVNSRLPGDFRIWPFQPEDNGRSVIVEIFPRFFYILAGANPRAWQNRDNVNRALKYFDSETLPPDLSIETEDQIDAIISAAAIRRLAVSQDTWHPPGLTDCARLNEGWIFGVV